MCSKFLESFLIESSVTTWCLGLRHSQQEFFLGYNSTACIRYKLDGWQGWRSSVPIQWSAWHAPGGAAHAIPVRGKRIQGESRHNAFSPWWAIGALGVNALRVFSTASLPWRPFLHARIVSAKQHWMLALTISIEIYWAFSMLSKFNRAFVTTSINCESTSDWNASESKNICSRRLQVS